MSAAAAAPFRMSVSHTSPDTTIHQVLDRIDSEVLVVDALGSDGVQGAIDAFSRRQPKHASFSLDLIAHARRGILQLGDWSVDGTGKSALLQHVCAAQLAQLNLCEIRLLGCNTAITTGGQEAMCGLSQIFGVPVKGTRMPISAADFGPYGFLVESVLSDQDHLPPIALPTFQTTGAWLSRFETVVGQTTDSIMKRLRRESLSDVIRDWSRTRPQLRWPVRQLDRRELEAVLVYAEPGLVNVPGLLALPDLEIAMPIEDDFGATRYHRLSLLLDGHWIRVYPRDLPDGMVLRTHGEEALAEALRRGTELLRP
jgi:hypothetical protein